MANALPEDPNRRLTGTSNKASRAQAHLCHLWCSKSPLRGTSASNSTSTTGTSMWPGHTGASTQAQQWQNRKPPAAMVTDATPPRLTESARRAQRQSCSCAASTLAAWAGRGRKRKADWSLTDAHRRKSRLSCRARSRKCICLSRARWLQGYFAEWELWRRRP